MPARPLRLGSERVDATAAQPATPPIFELPPHHFTTHGVVLGMTGSGKTGLSIVLVEEALRSGVPVIAIDLKGDLPNLLLTFPSLDKDAYLPWVDAEAAARDGVTPEQVAQGLADKWRAGLQKSGLGSAELQALRDAIEPRIITPGARIAEPVDVLSSLSRRSPLWDEDEDAALEQLAAGVSLLLQLAGRDGDPRGRDHVVLSALAERRLRAGEPAPLDQLLRDVLAPPVSRIGAMEFAEFLPARDQQALAQDLNTLVASAKLKTWLSGAPLDVGSWLARRDGKTPLVIFSVAHLDDSERALVLGLLLEEVLTWVRSLSGTSELRALLLFDEVFGFLPPHPANPPTKKPLLALLKQARAFGVGVVVATQNPMDLDYKALSNAGVWCVGRLQTDADRERVVEGLLGADGGLGGLDAATLGTIVRNLPPRTFFVRDVHRTPACALLETRFTMSWLRGPMTRKEIAKLAKPSLPTVEPPVAENAAETSGPSKAASLAAPPPPPEGWGSYFGPPGASGPVYRPYVAITVVLRAADSKLALTIERRHTLIAAFDTTGRVDAEQVAEIEARTLGSAPLAGISFAALPSSLATKKGAQAVEKSLREHAASRIALMVDVHRELGLHRSEGESRELFAARCNAEGARRASSGQSKINPAIAKLEERLRNTNEELAAARHALSAAPSEIGTAFLRAALGRGAGASLSKQRDKAEARLTKAEAAARKAEQAWREAHAEHSATIGQAQTDAAGQIETIRLLPKRGGVETVAIGVAWSAAGDKASRVDATTVTLPGMTPEALVAELDAQNKQALERIRVAATAGEAPDDLTVGKLLMLALKNELEATECAAAWIASTPEVDVKLALARQAGDEAKHYRLIQKRLAELGIETKGHDPLAQGRSPLLAFLLSLEDTVSRVAAGQFTREALAVVRNREFIAFCRTAADEATAKLYEDTIQPDESHHHDLGRQLLLALATEPAAQERALAASKRVLELAEELQEVARLRLGISRAPGC